MHLITKKIIVETRYIYPKLNKSKYHLLDTPNGFYHLDILDNSFVKIIDTANYARLITGTLEKCISEIAKDEQVNQDDILILEFDSKEYRYEYIA